MVSAEPISVGDSRARLLVGQDEQARVISDGKHEAIVNAPHACHKD
jgi:hypothetical protein